MRDKFTPPQIALLTELCTTGRARTNPSYPPAKNLVAGGYAFWKSGKYSEWLEPTGTGLAAYEDIKRSAAP